MDRGVRGKNMANSLHRMVAPTARPATGLGPHDAHPPKRGWGGERRREERGGWVSERKLEFQWMDGHAMFGRRKVSGSRGLPGSATRWAGNIHEESGRWPGLEIASPCRGVKTGRYVPYIRTIQYLPGWRLPHRNHQKGKHNHTTPSMNEGEEGHRTCRADLL